MMESAQAVNGAVKGATPALQKAASEGTGAAVDQSLKGAAETAAQALNMASRPVLNRLSGVVAVCTQAEGQLRWAAGWFSWRLAVLTAEIA